jgi:hypothetical protein
VWRIDLDGVLSCRNTSYRFHILLFWNQLDRYPNLCVVLTITYCCKPSLLFTRLFYQECGTETKRQHLSITGVYFGEAVTCDLFQRNVPSGLLSWKSGFLLSFLNISLSVCVCGRFVRVSLCQENNRNVFFWTFDSLFPHYAKISLALLVL